MISGPTDHRYRATIQRYRASIRTDDPASRRRALDSRSVSAPNIRLAHTARTRLRSTAAALRRRAANLERPAHPPARPPVQSGRLFQLAAIALLGLAALISAAPVKAQSVTTFVSNFGQGRDSDTFTRGVRAQTFRTGWDAGRFTLHSVDIKVESSSTIQGNAQSRFSMYLCTPNANGFPPARPADIPTHTDCVTLTPPSNFAAPATLTFTAPANTRLERGTHYILVNIATSGTPLYDATLSDGEDGDSATGWAIGNGYVWYNSHPDIRRYVHTGTKLNRYRGRIEVVPVTGPNQALRFAIKGTVDTGPTSSDKTVTTNEDSPHRFVVADFPFTGLESSDSLWGVKITSLPSAGELKLGTTLVTANQVIRSSDLDTVGTRLGFTPAANAHGDTYGSFTFMVMSGETTESDGGYTMTVAVTPVNDAATGTPTISGPVLVGRSLTAATAGIADIDGLPATSSFTYQWVRVDGSNETDIAGATAGAYTLAAADQGKKVKVKVSFTDNDGTVETRTSDAYPSSGAVAMSVVNAAPTAADQTVTTNEDTAYTFSADDFNFADTDAGNTLSNVTIVTLPASDKGTLKLDTTAVTAQQSVSKADLDADKLTFTPTANANGQARFTFKVSDGTDESASASAMTVAVTAVNDAATGAATIFGGSWVGRSVTALTDDIADIDGLPGTFTYQWVRVDGSDETDIAGETSRAYTLAAADEDKTVKVKVSFTDNDGTVETLTSEAFPSSDSVAAATTQSPDDIWSATLRVHHTGYSAGCNSQGSSGKCTSQLNDRDFTLAGDRYTFHRIGLSYLNALHIKFEYEGNFSPAELRNLTLYVDGASFPINTGELGVGGRIVTWENSGIPFSSWYNGKRVNLRLTAPKASTPSAPRSLAATGADRKLDLTWSAPEINGGGGISDYEYRYSAGASVAEDTPWISAGKDLKERVTGLTNGTAYAFEVRAVNRAGKSTAVTATGTPIAAACSSPALGGRHVVWSSKVKVASGSDFYGYDDTNGGSLDDSSLDFGVHSYVVDGAFVWLDGPTSDTLVLSFTSHLPSSLLAKLTLHVCDIEGFALADATRFGPYHYRWNNSGLDWSDVTERTLYLSIPVASCAAPALGDRRQVWTGKLKVAAHRDFFGYDGTQGGSLENPGFSVSDYNNTVDGAFLQRGADTGKLILSFKNALWSRLRPRLTLHVCDSEPFALDNTSNFGPNHYRWNDDMGLDWSELLERTLYLSQPANNAATGLPTITGTATVGETLTAVTTGIADTDGLPTSFAYQWVRVDGSDETGISGETSDTYTLAAADAGKKIKVVVSFTDIFGGEEMVTSDAFPSSSTVQQTGSGTQGAEAPTITGSPALSEAGADSAWTAGETAEVTLTFSEAVTVDTTGGTPSIGLDLGGTESRSATYLRGSGTTALVFGYTLTATDGSHTSLLVPIDSLALNGGTIRSQATSADAALGHLGAAKVSLSSTEGDPFTARFEGLPESHDGSGAFTFELRFSEAPEGLSYTTVAGGLMEVTGATVDKARRLTAGSNLAWEVTMTPSQSGDIAIRLPARACTETNAVCAGGRALDGAVSATVRGVPFTASFSAVPAEHDGSTAFYIRFHLSAEPAGLSYRTVQNGLFDVTGGSIEKASRLSAGKNNGWTLRILPSGLGDVTVRVNGTTACNTAPGVCTADGRTLGGGLSVSSAGPAALSVADAEVEEGADATLAFVVTLSKARAATTTVQYATADGSATVGADYTLTSGTLTFGRLETTKTVSVPVLDDSHDEGSETMTLTLSNASGARLGDATATGTITNSDPLPQALLARFGRTAAVHVVEQVQERIDAPREVGFEAQFAGRQLRPGMEREMAAEFLSQLAPSLGANRVGAGVQHPMSGSTVADRGAFGTPGLAGGASMAANPMGRMPGTDGGLNPLGHFGMGLGGGNMLTGSAFELSRETRRGGILSVWSRGAQSQFAGREGKLSLDGRVSTTMAGADYAAGPLVAGLSLSHSRGRGGYQGVDIGQVTSSVTGLYPWLGYKATDRISLWGVTGYGKGALTLTPGAGAALRSGLSMAMAAGGVRGELADSLVGGFGLAFKADALWVGTGIEGVDGPEGRLAAAAAAVTRFRTGLEASRSYRFERGLSLQPSLEVGLRRDGGDAETGAGVDIGGGLFVSDRVTGLSADIRVRMLLAHQDEEFRERGLSISFSFDPTPSTPLGFMAKVTPSWGGQATGGAQALWGQETMAGMPQGGVASGNRLEAELGYGMAVGSWLVGMPRFGIGTSEYGRDYRLGYSLTVAQNGAMSFELGVDALRRESVGQQGAEHGVQGRLTARW